jgi:hypothetical protein
VSSDDDTFAELAGSLVEPIIVSITAREGFVTADYDVDGTDDLEKAIGVVVKGLFALVMDAMGHWDDLDDEDEDEDEDPDLLS